MKKLCNFFSHLIVLRRQCNAVLFGAFLVVSISFSSIALSQDLQNFCLSQLISFKGSTSLPTSSTVIVMGTAIPSPPKNQDLEPAGVVRLGDEVRPINPQLVAKGGTLSVPVTGNPQ